MSQVSVIIPTSFGGFTYLAELLPGLAQEPQTELIIIDNGSKDGTTNYLSNYDCIIKINKQKMSFSQSNNAGARLASSEYLLFLNNDTRIFPNLINKMQQTFLQDEKIGIVGCAIYTMDDPQKIQHAGVMFTNDYLPYELGLDVPGVAPGIPIADPRVRSVREVPSVTGACMMIKKSIFNEIGGFDEGYQFGWEDTDLVLRAKEKGYKVWYNGEAMIKHKHYGTPGRFLFEAQNRSRYDSIWVSTGRAKTIVGERREI